MSGTAMDGIDAAIIETDGLNTTHRIGFHSISHDPILRQKLQSCMNKTEFDKGIEAEFTRAHMVVIHDLLSQNGLSAGDIDIIGFHGQTIHHDPYQSTTIQMGDGQLLADETGIDVIYDFRSNDMKHGGQGAPLLPIYHQALAQNAQLNFPIVILNLGGVGNITYIDHDNMIAFDTGPANAMIDDWVKTHTGKDFDDNGDIASQGQVNQTILNEFLSLDYFNQPYPKSLDRNDFKTISVDGLTCADGAATLTAMTIQSIAKGIALCPTQPNALYVTGGGRHNGFIMTQIQKATNIPTNTVDTLGWNGDAMEAEGFAYMAVRSLLGHPISFPNTTGCDKPSTGGIHIKPKRRAA